MKHFSASFVLLLLSCHGFSQCPYGGSLSGIELVTNGDFSGGNTGFSTDYIYCNTPLCIYTEGLYAIGPDPNYFHSQFYGVDHTTGTGNLMVINGAPNAATNIWCETITVQPYTTYVFSYWLASMYVSNAAQLRVMFNGIATGTLSTAPNAQYTWLQFSVAWNSGINTSVDVCLIDENLAVFGNDFGIDDISFQQCVCSSTLIPEAGPDAAICPGDSVQLNASGGSGYSWSPVIGLSDSLISNPIAEPPTTTIYYVTVYDSAGCSAVDSVTVFVNLSPSIVTSNDTDICYGTSSSLFAAGGISYSWSPASSLNDSTLYNPIATPDSTTVYYVTVTDTAGCFGTDSVLVAVNPLPVISTSGDTTICRYSAISISASGGVAYLWSTGESTTAITVNPSTNTSYTVSVTDTNQCVSSATINVLIAPDFLIVSGDEICIGDSTLLTASGAAIIIWNDTITNSEIMVAPVASTLYTAVGFDGMCWDTASVNVIVHPLPLADAGSDVEILLGAEITLNATGGISCNWSPSTGLSCDACCDPLASPKDTTEYFVTVTDDYGCKASDSVKVYVIPPDEVYIPDAFTPNGDGVNDVFLPILSGETEMTAFKIFNRWGQLVYFSSDKSHGWDGNFNGLPEEISTYVYCFIGENKETGQVIEKKGNVTLLR
ncbi:MAG TPA: T9SS type B sorting domain-containing protein [Chitinophagales bacterium]|nr:T9SS type B sorting domain-containing protein [Chitinophagales bacterium]